MEKELYTNIYQIEDKHWWYAARRAIIFDWIFRLLSQKNEPRILDIGCGTGFNIDHLKNNGFSNVYGIDIADDALIYCQRRGVTNILGGDVQALPFSEQSFDLICALDILEHVEDDLMALCEIRRILKPGGVLVVFTPAYQFLWSLQDDISHHCRRYTATELRNKVVSAGYSIKKLTYANTILFPVIWLGRLLLRIVRTRVNLISESDLNPRWSNEILKSLFLAEKWILQAINLPFGVSLLCICESPENNQ